MKALLKKEHVKQYAPGVEMIKEYLYGLMGSRKKIHSVDLYNMFNDLRSSGMNIKYYEMESYIGKALLEMIREDYKRKTRELGGTDPQDEYVHEKQ